MDADVDVEVVLLGGGSEALDEWRVRLGCGEGERLLRRAGYVVRGFGEENNLDMPE